MLKNKRAELVLSRKPTMKTKKIVIKSRDEIHEQELEYGRRIDRGEKVHHLRGEYFESIEAVRKFLTETRLELWRTIRDKKPNSISELAQLVHRNFADVHQDLRILLDVGLIDFCKPKGSKTRAKKPISLADELHFKVG